MAWQGILGHDRIVEQFRRGLEAGRLGSTFLFVGPRGIGKRTFAFKLAQSLLCTRREAVTLDPCGSCSACQQVLSESHPDLDVIRKPEKKSFIPVELLIGDKAHRLREGLCARIAMKPSEGGRRIAIIDDADNLNPEGANCLLKTLEEPPPRSVLILIGTSLQRQLPTIRSRCQIVSFRPLAPAVAEQLILSSGIATVADEAARLAKLCDGSLATAAALSDAAFADFRGQLYRFLETTDWIAHEQAQLVGEFVDDAGKEASARRERLRLVIEMVTEYYRHVLRAVVGAELAGDVQLVESARRLAADWAHDVEAVNTCLERCVVARQDVDRNVNQATNIEAWLDDLARVTARGTVVRPPDVTV